MKALQVFFAWVCTFFQELGETHRLHQEELAENFARQKRQQLIAEAYPHYIPVAGGVLWCFAALSKRFPDFIAPSRVEDVILPPLDRVFLNARGEIVFRFRALWKQPEPRYTPLGGGRLKSEPVPLVPVDKLEAALTETLPAYLGPRGYGASWARVIEGENDSLIVLVGGVQVVNAAVWGGGAF